MKSIKNISHKVAAALTVAVTMVPSLASANPANNLATVTQTLSTNLLGVRNIIPVILYIAGLVFAATGVFSLKKHVDAPQQVAAKDGLARLGLAAALLSFGYFTQVLMGTMTANTAANTFAGSVATFN